MKHIKFNNESVFVSTESLWDDVTSFFNKSKTKDSKKEDHFDYYDIVVVKDYLTKINNLNLQFKNDDINLNSYSHVLGAIVVNSEIPDDLVKRLNIVIQSFGKISNISEDKRYSDFLDKSYKELITLKTSDEVIKKWSDLNSKFKDTPFSKVKDVDFFKFKLSELKSFKKPWVWCSDFHDINYERLDKQTKIKPCDSSKFKDINKIILNLVNLYLECAKNCEKLFFKAITSRPSDLAGGLLDLYDKDYDHEIFNYLFDFHERKEYPYVVYFIMELCLDYITALCYYVRNSLVNPNLD